MPAHLYAGAGDGRGGPCLLGDGGAGRAVHQAAPLHSGWGTAAEWGAAHVRSLQHRLPDGFHRATVC